MDTWNKVIQYSSVEQQLRFAEGPLEKPNALLGHWTVFNEKIKIRFISEIKGLKSLIDLYNRDGVCTVRCGLRLQI